MTILEQLKEDKKSLQSLHGKDKWEYIWDYYKIPIVAVTFVLFCIIYTVVSASTRGNVNLYAMLINADQSVESNCVTEILQEAGFDMEENQAHIERNYTLHPEQGTNADAATMQVIAAQFMIGDLDIFVAEENIFKMYQGQGCFENVGLLLPMELKEQKADDLYYYTDEDGVSKVVGVWLRQGSPLHQAGYYTKDVLVGIASQAANLDEATAVVIGLFSATP